METSYAQGTNSAEERDSCEERHLTKSPSQANIAAHDQEEDNSDNSHLIMDANHVCVTPSGAAPESGGSNLPECQNEEISTQASGAGHRDTLLDVADEDISMATTNDSLNDIFVQISSLRSAMNSVVAGLDELEKSCRTIYQNSLKSFPTQQHMATQGSRAEPLIAAQNRETYTRVEFSTTAAQNGEGDELSTATQCNEGIRNNVTIKLGNEGIHESSNVELSNRDIHTEATHLTAELGNREETHIGGTPLIAEQGNSRDNHTGASHVTTAASNELGSQIIAEAERPELSTPQGNCEELERESHVT